MRSKKKTINRKQVKILIYEITKFKKIEIINKRIHERKVLEQKARKQNIKKKRIKKK